MNPTINKTAAVLLLALGMNYGASANNYQMAEINYAPPKIAVYNDGKNTYIQAIPGLVIKGATADGDRLIITGVPREIHGWMAGKPITINQYTTGQQAPAYSGPARSAAPQAPSVNASELLAARLSNLEKELQKKEQAYKAAAPVTVAVAAPVAPIATPVPVKPSAPAQVWEIRKSDGTLYGALTRWAASAKPERQLIYATEGNDFSLQEGSFTGDFDSAIAQVMESMKYSNYPLRACGWDNKPRPVVKIIHKNKRCED